MKYIREVANHPLNIIETCHKYNDDHYYKDQPILFIWVIIKPVRSLHDVQVWKYNLSENKYYVLTARVFEESIAL